MKNKLINRGKITEIHIESKYGKKIALIDTEDIHKLNKVETIHVAKTQKNKDYFAVICRINKKSITLSRLLMNPTNTGEIVDHKNRNPLDNRSFNLRIVTHDENMRNRDAQHNSKSGIGGIGWEKEKWRVRFWYKKKRYHLGYFETLEEAKEVKDKFMETLI